MPATSHAKDSSKNFTWFLNAQLGWLSDTSTTPVPPPTSHLHTYSVLLRSTVLLLLLFQVHTSTSIQSRESISCQVKTVLERRIINRGRHITVIGCLIWLFFYLNQTNLGILKQKITFFNSLFLWSILFSWLSYILKI